MAGTENGNGVVKLSKAARRRRKKKELKKQQQQGGVKVEPGLPVPEPAPARPVKQEPQVKQEGADQNSKPEVEYVKEELDLTDPNLSAFKDIFAKFESRKAVETIESAEEKKEEKAEEEKKNEPEEQEAQEEPKVLSKKAQKKKNRLKVAELKQLVQRPDVVEIHDCNSANPQLLVYLKAYRNTVPVPKHWSQKRKYLQGKRGVEKQPFRLPQFIADTGIADIRDQQRATDDGKKSSQRQREKMQPKIGKIDIDYNVLHDAFFRFQTRPEMTGHGDLYYEGKEFEVTLSDKKPGELSDTLRAALGMHSETAPPPWLYNMQRIGPPPSYPNLQVPGVNYPIPKGAAWGYGPGEWGKPPIDEYGQALWGGDVYGAGDSAHAQWGEDASIDKTRWGVLEAEESEEEESDAEDEEMETAEEEQVQPPQPPAHTGSDATEGTLSTLSSVPGAQTPDTLQLRKQDGTGTETPNTVNKPLYTVLEEKKTSVGGALFGTDRTYVLPEEAARMQQQTPQQSAMEAKRASYKAKIRQQVNVSLNPEDLEGLDAESLKRKYESTLKAQKDANKTGRPDIDEVYREQLKKKRKK